jgi:HK97 family phage portal protein
MLASSLFRPRNRATTVTPLGSLDQVESLWSNAGDARSGVAVTQSTALTLPAFWQGVRKVAQDVAILEFHVYRRRANGDRERAPESPWWRLVHDRPNPWQTSQQFRECMTGLALLRGRALALPTVVRGQVVELLPLRPGSWRVEQRADFSLRYFVQNDRGGETEYGREDVFEIAGFGLDATSSLGLLAVGREAIGEALAQTQYSSGLFGNGARPGGYLKSAGPLTKQQAADLKENWEESHRGLDNAHRVAVLPYDLSWQDVGMTAETAQLIEQRQFTVLDMARLIDIPPHKLFELGRATWGNTAQMQEEYWLSIQSWAKRWENEHNQRVIRDDQYFAEMLPETILRLDAETQTKVLAQRVGNGLTTPNEGRRALNLPTMDGGDVLLVPANPTALGADGPVAPPAPAAVPAAARAAAALASLTRSLAAVAAPAVPLVSSAGAFPDPRVEQAFVAAVRALRDRGKAAHQVTVVDTAAEMGYSRTSLHDLMRASGVDFAAKVAEILAD